jgi:hypothetical protein
LGSLGAVWHGNVAVAAGSIYGRAGNIRHDPTGDHILNNHEGNNGRGNSQNSKDRKNNRGYTVTTPARPGGAGDCSGHTSLLILLFRV